MDNPCTDTGTAYRVGSWVEALAVNYLVKQGLRRLHQNYRCRVGEIDVIMQDARYLVFVEVRYRKNDDFGGAKASITREKQRKIRKVAQFYLQRFGAGAQYIFCRFDAVAVCAAPTGLSIEWLRDAF
jgi:putative endonuclease